MVDLGKITLDDSKHGLSDDEHLAHVLSEILTYFESRCYNRRRFRRNAVGIMDSVTELFVNDGLWGKMPDRMEFDD